MNDSFWDRFKAVMTKEFRQMRRDRVTVALILWFPIMQLLLFGYAINTNPKHLPTVLVLGDNSQFVRTFVTGMENSDYFRIVKRVKSEEEAKESLRNHSALFAVTFPPNFTEQLVRGQHPQLLVEADATDGVAVSSALSAIQELANTVLASDFQDNLSSLNTQSSSVDLIIHPLYNPEDITSLNIVPGLLGVILTMTMIMVTSQTITRELEYGNMEMLLATPLKPLETMIGKMVPYVLLGYLQMAVALIMAVFLFKVPVLGSLTLLVLCALPFIGANLAIGLTFSTMAENQLQAVNLTFFFFLPSILLSGFMFPFWGMPTWAIWLGQALPMTHFLRICRGILLKGNGFKEVWPDVWPMLVFMGFAILVAVKRYRQTLD